jgi:hypothetical protein
MAPFLSRLAAAGVIAMSCDAWQHGDRTQEPSDQLMIRGVQPLQTECLADLLTHHTPPKTAAHSAPAMRPKPSELVDGLSAQEEHLANRP